MLVFRDARVCRARIVVITESRRGFKLVIGAKPLPAAVVLEAFTGVCQSADCTIVWMRVCRVRWPDYWQAAHWVSPGRSCKHSLATRSPTRGFWALTTAPASPLYWARRCLVSPRRWNSFHGI